MMMISDKQRIIKETHLLTVASGVNFFPLKMSLIMNYLQSHHGIVFIKYSVFAKKQGCSIYQVAEHYNSNESALRYYPEDNAVRIIYNDQQNKARVQWSLGHEIAHFRLGHHLIQNEAACQGLDLSKMDKEKIEAEANFFAKVLLAPLDIVLFFMAKYQAFDGPRIYTILRTIFRLSQAASYYYVAFLENNHRTLHTLVNTDISDYFGPFCRRIVEQYNSAAFNVWLRRYEDEYYLTRSRENTKVSGMFYPRYAESTGEIISRILPQQNSQFA